VRFIAEPSGSTPEPTVEGALFEVEGTIIGDDRRWGSLRISWTDGAGETEGADTMVVRSRPSSIRSATWSARRRGTEARR